VDPKASVAFVCTGSSCRLVECFRNIAAHLETGGCFVIEVFVPILQRLPPGETVRAFTVPTRLGFDEYDIAAQICVSHHYWIADDKLEVFSARSGEDHVKPDLAGGRESERPRILPVNLVLRPHSRTLFCVESRLRLRHIVNSD
jgi:hypothetical protein